MPANRQRLDRFISVTLGINRRHTKPLLAKGKILVDGIPAFSADQLIDDFSRIIVDGQILQDIRPLHLMLNKPVGVLSATRDKLHPTVIELLDHPQRDDLHIVGRLDRNSSGLLLLTNDGRWSQAVMAPENRDEKIYLVTLKNPLSEDYIDAFAAGMHFPFENVTTLPAKLEILESCVAKVTLREGRYHQIKRMFGRFRNPVFALHRIAIGPVKLDATLTPGHSRELTEREAAEITLA